MTLRIVIALVFLSVTGAARADWLSLWLTPDQQGERLFEHGDYAEAARKFTTPERIGVALFRAGEFKQAAAVFGRSNSAEAAYNRGNALVMQGQYEAAMSSYELALQRKPGWLEAEQNLEIARLRKLAMAPPEDDYGGTGGQLEADEIVLDSSGRVNKSSQEQTIEAGDQSLSEEALRALWLRRVQTRPADFLAAKFAYQLAAQESESAEEGSASGSSEADE
jgi:Ca-activated chloride channel family protein